jgi:cytochrome P450
VKALWKSDSEQRLLSFLCSVADGYEPRNNLSQYLLFGPRAYHVLDPRNVETILSTNFSDYGFGVRNEVFAPLLGHGIFTQEGHAWKHSRELLRQQFVRAQYQNLANFSEHVDNLIVSLHNVGGEVDLQPLFQKLTLDTTTALLFGKSVYSLKAKAANDEFIAFANNFDIAQGGLAKRFRLAPWHFLYSPPHFRRACSAVHGFVDNYIQEREEESSRKKDHHAETTESFVDQLAKESNSQNMLRDQLLNILLAGRDTTACCLSWTL